MQNGFMSLTRFKVMADFYAALCRFHKDNPYFHGTPGYFFQKATPNPGESYENRPTDKRH